MSQVLIIDDDAMYLKVMEELLQQNGWQVLLAQDGEGSRRWRALPPLGANASAPATTSSEMKMNPMSGSSRVMMATPRS